MKDYSCYSILESASYEIIELFVKHMNQIDNELAVKRLKALATCDPNNSFVDIASKFNSLIGTQTSADL